MRDSQISFRVTTNTDTKFVCSIDGKRRVSELSKVLINVYSELLMENEKGTFKNQNKKPRKVLKITKDGFNIPESQIVEHIFKNQDKIDCEFAFLRKNKKIKKLSKKKNKNKNKNNKNKDNLLQKVEKEINVQGRDYHSMLLSESSEEAEES